MPKSAPDNLASDPDLDEKRRARRRLLGAVVLALLAAVLLPLFLDSEPRKPAQEVQVEIQPREPSRLEPQAQAEGSVNANGAAPQAQAPSARPEAAPAKVDAEPEVSAGRSAEIASKSKPAAAVTSATGGAKARQGDEPAKAAAAARPAASAPKASGEEVSAERPFAVQIGAFASDKGAKEQLELARKAGLKAYTERIETSKGTRVRVRVGPFKTREEAEKARVRLKAAGIDSAIIAP